MADENVSDVTRTGHAYVASVNVPCAYACMLMPVSISQVRTRLKFARFARAFYMLVHFFQCRPLPRRTCTLSPNF